MPVSVRSEDRQPRAADPPGGSARVAIEALAVALAMTLTVTAASALLPDRYVASAVGFLFLAGTWLLVWRRDDAWVEASGLALGGIVLPGEIDRGRLARSILQAIGWATLLAAIFFVPFFFGWRFVWHPKTAFTFHVPASFALNEVFGQVVIIALPEEAFYRGYLQSRLDEAWPGFGQRVDGAGSRIPRRISVFGASVGPAVLVTSFVFALGHLATIHDPARLAVFFPSLAFGWLRLRTGGVGAGIAFHAMCNVYSELLGKGFGLY